MNDRVKILIIDDSEDDRMLYRRLLQKQPDAAYDTEEADHGDAGLEALEKSPPACILLDYSLPGHNGLEVLKRIRMNHPYVPVVMLTGQGNEAVAVQAIQQGAQNYIAKSTITTESLQRVLQMAIEHCALERRIHDQRTSLEVFTRALAHDLKEPVRTIRSFVELVVEDKQLSEKTRHRLDYIRHAADRMHMLIDTVFLYTQLEAPGLIPHEACDLPSVLADVEQNLHRLIDDRRAHIVYASLSALYANRTQLSQLLQNLIANAINHSDNPVTVTISVTPENEQARLCVADDGPGIEPAYLKKIFEPFRRLSHREQQGAGLGLAICKKIVDQHGGKIWCESAPGKGASFICTLPLATQAAAPANAPQATSAKTAAAPGAERMLANVLVVDDSKADVEITRFRLIERSQLRCNFFVANGGEEALKLLREPHTPIDLMLLDINMPEVDGFEVLEQLRAEALLGGVAVVMCSGSAYDKDIARARELGAAGYLIKPVEFSKLKSLIDLTPGFQLHQNEDGYALLRAA